MPVIFHYFKVHFTFNRIPCMHFYPRLRADSLTSAEDMHYTSYKSESAKPKQLSAPVLYEPVLHKHSKEKNQNPPS